METKICNKCEIKKNINDFHLNLTSKDKHRTVCKECRKSETKLNYEKNKIRYNNQSTKWNKKNKEKRKKIVKKHKQKPFVKLKENVRHRLYMFLKSKKMTKTNKTYIIVGCSPLELRDHLEKKFTNGMTWENYGIWHVDHIIPLDFATTIDDLYKLSHYTNLQPMWGTENLSKGKKII